MGVEVVIKPCSTIPEVRRRHMPKPHVSRTCFQSGLLGSFGRKKHTAHKTLATVPRGASPHFCMLHIPGRQARAMGNSKGGRTSFEMIIAVHIYREPPITRKLSYGRVEGCALRSSEVPGYYALIWKLKERANPSKNCSFASGIRSCRARKMAYDPACGTIYHDWSKTAGERTCLCAPCHQVGALLNTSGSLSANHEA